ncbi:hypothetical protein BC835DRAFT_1322983 [Cytidiella melzeri]|nr:hypothetical protein BC835DRAFT_1322983 [Cytidiella melzeri]
MKAGEYDEPMGRPNSQKTLSSSTPGDILPAPVLQSRPEAAVHKKRTATTHWLRAGWQRISRNLNVTDVPPSSEADVDLEDVVEGNEYYGTWWGPSKRGVALAETEQLDEVVVDREWGDELRSCGGSEQEGGKLGNHPVAAALAPVPDDSESTHSQSVGILTALRWRMYEFFDPRFSNKNSEEVYKRENWYLRKPIAIWSAGFYIINWIISVAFIPKPILPADKIFLWGIAPAFTFPLFFMIVYDFPRNRRVLYQVFLTMSTWMWSIYLLCEMFSCGYYTPHKEKCGSKDFLSIFYYSTGPPVVALFGLYSDRLPAFVGIVTFMSLAWGMIVPDRHTWSRNIINFLIYQVFLLYLHYQRETAERRLYTLRDELKVQFRATQKAQINERRAADSKRRLTSYVFHEVRVPLNTALLAVQNMAASRDPDSSPDIEFTALEGSLSMMSKVLNDVLDFNRMDSGRFESLAKPYSFHQVMKSLFVPLRLATDARGLTLVTELDENIDEVARRALYHARGYSEEQIAEKMAHSLDAVVVGDETRLRQIITNLASNACKFTPAGGTLIVSTKLVRPVWPLQHRTDSETLTTTNSEYCKDIKDDITIVDSDTKEANHISPRKMPHHCTSAKKSSLEQIVVRIEVTDTGTGISPKDMVESNLFSAFTQTDLGRQQGGKGTGLGLALVRQIVKLSGGRLGVQSKVGSGSTFWVELPLGVGAKALSWTNLPHFTPQTTTPRQEATFFPPGAMLDMPLKKDITSPAAFRRPMSRINAMHSIMEQQGMVEISTKHEDDGKILTRTIGDSSTGTDPTPTVPLTTPESSPIITSAVPPALSTLVSETTTRPNFVQIPSRHSFGFGFDEPLAEHTPAHTPSDGSTPHWELGLRVLVVDDDPLTRKLMARMLKRLGCKVSTAENGGIALDLVLNGCSSARPTPSSENHNHAGLSLEAATAGHVPGDELKYAVVFLDNQMPVMSGLETVAALRELGRKDFVVGVTGNALLDDQQEFTGAGADFVLTKPVQEKALKSMLAIADQRQRQRTLLLEPPEPPAPP